jgi:hypothetical protein
MDDNEPEQTDFLPGVPELTEADKAKVGQEDAISLLSYHEDEDPTPEAPEAGAPAPPQPTPSTAALAEPEGIRE